MLIRHQRIYNLWSIHAMFTMILYDFDMIWLELTWTDVVSAELPWCRFLCKNKSSRNGLKIYGDFLWTKRSPWSKKVGPEESRAVHEGGGAPIPLGVGPCLVATSKLPLRTLQVPWIASVPKITFPKVSFRLDSIWYSFSSKHWNRQENNNMGWASG